MEIDRKIQKRGKILKGKLKKRVKKWKREARRKIEMRRMIKWRILRMVKRIEIKKVMLRN